LNQPKIYERNPDTGVVRWRYIGESPDDYGWPNYGNLIPTDECHEDSNVPEQNHQDT
jgi:hypothetical protein